MITAVAVIGGGLFGFDISSMSAIISTPPYLCYFNQVSISAAMVLSRQITDGKSGTALYENGWKVFWSQSRRAGWHHSFYAWRLLVRCLDFWLLV